MFKDFIPRLKIGTIKPLSVIDLSAYEFYRLAPPGVMLVMIGAGLAKFTKDDVERVFAPVDGYMDQLVERGADLVMQSGVPLPLLLGVDGHDRLIERMAARSGKLTGFEVAGADGKWFFADASVHADTVWAGNASVAAPVVAADVGRRLRPLRLNPRDPAGKSLRALRSRVG